MVAATASIRFGARVGRAARRRLFADPRAALRALLVALLGWAAVSLLLPDPAQADIVSDAVVEAVQNVLGWVFQTIMWGIFGRINARITQDLISWLVAIPNFSPGGSGAHQQWDYEKFVLGPQHSSIDAARNATTMLSLGALGAVMTLSVIRYWLSGLTMRGSGGFEAIEGLTRSLFAVGLMLLWPEAFRLFVALANSATHTLLTWPSVDDNLAQIMGEGGLTRAMLTLDAGGVIVSILIYVGLALMMIVLVLMKILLTAGTSVLYVLMPLAIALWPLPETSWVANVTARAWLVCMLVPVIWAVLFISFAAVGSDYFSLGGQGDILDVKFIKPLVTVAMLWLAVLLPRALARAALMGAISSATGANVQSLGSIGSVVRPFTAPLRMLRGAQNTLRGMQDVAKTAEQFSSAQKGAVEGGASPRDAAKAGLMSVLGVGGGAGAGGGGAGAGGGGAGAGAGAGAGKGSGAGSKGSSRMSGDLHTDAGGWPDMHGRRAGLEPVPRPPRAADDAPLSEGADSPAPQPQLGDDHVPKPGQLDTLRWHANRVRSGTSSAASTGDDVIHSARLHADHPALASIKTDPGPGGATLAMSSLTPTDRQQVAHQTQSSAISDQQWESSMLTRATNPAYTPAEQQAWFSFAAAGRPAVQQAIDVGAHEAEGDWESGTAAAHTPSVQSSPSAPAPSAQPSPSPAAPPSPPSAPARPRQRRTAPSPPAPSAAPTPPRAAPAPPPPAAPASPPARPTPQPAPSSDPFADVPPPPDEPWDEEA